MAAETKDQALDLVAAIFVRAGERVPAERNIARGNLSHLAAQRDLSEREAA